MKRRKVRVVSLLLALVLVLAAIPVSVSAAESTTYTVTLTQDEKVKYQSAGSKGYFTVKSGSYKSIYAKVAAAYSADYYVDHIDIEPADAAKITHYQKTGEVLIENVTSDFTLTPVVLSKNGVANLDVSWQFVTGGVYSEENPAATVEFTVTATDANGNPAANATLYYKSDRAEKSYSNALQTDTNGVATVKHAYAVQKGVTSTDFTALFSTDSSFAGTSLEESVSLTVVQQKKADLYLTTDQVKDSLANEANGSVINVNPLYEYFTGVLHQGAINTASGEWVTPENGTIEGLAPGQYALRFRERVEGNTIYLYSDYDYFTIGRATWTITASDNSSNVTFPDAARYAEPGGDVFFYVTPNDGYEVTDVSVSKPNYVSDISYNAEDGYVKLSGVTGSFDLTVTAEPVETVTDVVAFAAPAKTFKVAALGLTATTLAVDADVEEEDADVEEEEADELKITDVRIKEGTDSTLQVTIQVPEGTTDTPTAYKKANTDSKYTSFTVKKADDGTYSGTFSAKTSTGTEYTYDLYAVLGDTESQHITIKTKKPTLNKTNDFTITSQKGNKANGKITYTGTEDSSGFYAYKQGATSTYYYGSDNVIAGLTKGTWYVIFPSAALDAESTGADYYFRIKNSVSNLTISQVEDDAQYYTVKFVNAAGKTVSEKEYEENTAAEDVTVPAITENYTDSDGIYYSYSWPTVTKVTEDAVYIEQVKKQSPTQIAVNGVTINKDNAIEVSVEVQDKNGNVLPINDYSSIGASLNGGANSYSKLTNGTYTFTINSSSYKTGEENTLLIDFKGNDNYLGSISTHVTFTVTKAAKPELTATPAHNAGSDGTITVTSDYEDLVWYAQGSSTEAAVPEDGTITGLVGNYDSYNSGTYYVYVVPQAVEGSAQYNFVSASDKASIKVENVDVTYYTLTTDEDVTVILPKGVTRKTLEYNTKVTLYKEGATAWEIIRGSGDEQTKKVVGYGDTYSFYIGSDIEVRPVSDTYESPKPEVNTVSVSKASNTYKVKFLVTITDADGWTVKEHGFLYGKNIPADFLTEDNIGKTPDESTGKTAAGAVKKWSSTTNAKQYALNYGLTAQTAGDIAIAKPYLVIVDKDGTTETVWGDTLAYIYS